MAQDDFSKQLQQEYETCKQENPRPRILVMGGTGVGKSSLINKCFNAELAQTGTGWPVTQEIRRYENSETPVVLYDTKGYEIGNGKEDEFISRVVDFASESVASKEPIHLAWYCIQASGHRVTDFDLQAIARIREQGIPVAIVLTKAELVSTEAAEEIRKSAVAGSDIPFFETSAVDKSQPWQLTELCEWSIEQLPAAVRRSFIAAQKQSLEAKRKECQKIIQQHTASAAVVGFSPIPVSDGPILLGIQGTMVARIVYVYGLENLLKSKGTEFIATLIAPIIMQSGIMLAASLLKFIPGLGSIAGGAINAAVALSITWSIGLAFTSLCEQMLTADMEGGEYALKSVLDSAADIFRENFAEEIKKKR